MTTQTTLVAFVGSLVLGACAYAQTSQPAGLASKYVDPVSGLSLPEAIGRALEHEPDLRAARTEVDAARGMRLQAGLRPNPTISFSQQEEPSGPDRQTRVEASLPLDLFRRAGRTAVADREIDAERFAVADRERLAAADVRVKYGDVAAAVREIAVLDDLFAAASKQHALVAARVEQGSTPPFERDVLRVDLQRLESERMLQYGSAERALIELKRTLGVPPDAPLKIREDLEQLVLQEATGAFAADDAPDEARPDVEAARARVQVADAQIERARREGRVDVNLFGMYMRMNSGFPLRAFGNGGLEPIRGVFHNVAGGAAITIPLRDRNQGNVAAARALRAGASARLEAALLTAHAELAAARVRDDQARRSVAVYTSDTMALARRNLAVVGQTYELGRATVFDLLAEQRRYLDVERAFTSALRETYEARQALRRALGDVR